ncbi:MAG: DUF1989 domain-containing protein, partial [Neisseriales bacterium]
MTIVMAKEIAPQSGGWLKLNSGDLLKITDLDGEQVADLFAVSADDMREYLSVGTTRAGGYKMFPKVGDRFLSNKYKPMLNVVRDDS